MEYKYDIRDPRVISQEPIVGGFYIALKKFDSAYKGALTDDRGTFQYVGDGIWVNVEKGGFTDKLPEYDFLELKSVPEES